MIILKIILIAVLVLLGLILLLLLLPVQAEISFIGGGFSYKLRYAFINFMDSGGGGILGSGRKKKKTKKNKSVRTEKISPKDKNPETTYSYATENSAPKQEKTQEKVPCAEKSPEVYGEIPRENPKTSGTEDKAESKPKQKSSAGDKVELIMNIWNCAKHPVRRLLKGFHISNVYIDFFIADEDAYKCALKYGRICGSVYIMLAHLANIFTVKYKTVDINAGFAKEKSRWDAGCNIYFLPVTAVISAVWFLAVYFFRIYLPRKRKSKKICRKAEISAARRNVRSGMENNTKSKVSDLMGISMEKIKEMTDVDSIIGEPIRLEDGTTIIPVSRVSYGFASGGSDLPSKSDKNLFGGGAGGGVSIKPEGFLVVSGGNAKMVSVNSSSDPISSFVSNVPEMVDKISNFIKKKKGGSDEESVAE